MDFIFTLVIIISIVLIIIEVIRALIKINESYSREKLNKRVIKSFVINTQHIVYLEETCIRKEIIYRSYILHNSLYLISNFFSLKYSIATFATSVIALDKGASWKATVLSVLTMTFVVINMCIKPSQHANQYLLAWRKYEEHTQYMLQHNYNKLSYDEISDLIKQSIEVRANIESSLKHDENNDS